MTVIAWDGKTLAADKRMGTALPAVVTKVHRGKHGDLMGVCGWMDKGLGLIEWWDAGADPASFPSWNTDPNTSAELMIVKPDCSLWIVSAVPHAMRIEQPFRATGSGRDFAMAAMHLGKSAREAVEIASLYCAECGNGVDTLEFQKEAEEDLRGLVNGTPLVVRFQDNSEEPALYLSRAYQPETPAIEIVRTGERFAPDAINWRRA